MRRLILGLTAALLWLSACGPTAYTVYPEMETEPVASEDDAADDPAIFIHPDDLAKNVIIGTDKQMGLIVYGVDGRILHQYEVGRINNVDLRQEVEWDGDRITIVGGSNRSDNSLVFYQLDEATRALTSLHDRPIASDVNEVYGFCLYHSEELYAFVVGKDGIVEQWALAPGNDDRLEARRVRTFDVGNQCEGLVADDELGFLYVGEEEVGIWKYGAEPADGDSRRKVQTIDENKNLKADIEGLTIYYGEGETGYLIASSQGNHTYALYERAGDNRYLGSFRIEGKNGIDGTFDTDGIDVTHRGFSEAFPHGIFVAQDGKNGRESQNFKVVDWRQIEKQIPPAAPPGEK